MYAIAKVSGTNASGFTGMEIVNCPTSALCEVIGREWMADRNSGLHTGEFHLIRFTPEDQFCTVVALDKVREPDTHYAAEAKENLLRTVKHHRAHCDGPACDIQLFLLRKLADMAGLEFTDEESKLFL